MENLFYSILRHICILLFMKLYIIFLSSKSHGTKSREIQIKIKKWEFYMLLYFIIACFWFSICLYVYIYKILISYY